MFFLAACSCFKYFINRYKYMNIYIDIYACMYICMCVCVCLCVCVCGCLCVCLCVCVFVLVFVFVIVYVCCVCWRERREGVVVVVMVGGWVLCLSFPPQCPSGQLKLNSFQVERMIGGIGHVLFSICSQTENG